MSITLRLIQNYDVRHEAEFWELERKFIELEKRRKDFLSGKRMKPVSSAEPCNTLIWEGEFPDLAAAKAWLDFTADDPDHDELFRQQVKFFKDVRVEFYENFDGTKSKHEC